MGVIIQRTWSPNPDDLHLVASIRKRPIRKRRPWIQTPFIKKSCLDRQETGPQRVWEALDPTVVQHFSRRFRKWQREPLKCDFSWFLAKNAKNVKKIMKNIEFKEKRNFSDFGRFCRDFFAAEIQLALLLKHRVPTHALFWSSLES